GLLRLVALAAGAPGQDGAGDPRSRGEPVPPAPVGGDPRRPFPDRPDELRRHPGRRRPADRPGDVRPREWGPRTRTGRLAPAGAARHGWPAGDRGARAGALPAAMVLRGPADTAAGGAERGRGRLRHRTGHRPAYQWPRARM